MSIRDRINKINESEDISRNIFNVLNESAEECADKSKKKCVKESKKCLKEDSYDEGIFSDIEDALYRSGLDVTRFNDAGIMTDNLGWVVENTEGEVQIECLNTSLRESKKELTEAYTARQAYDEAIKRRSANGYSEDDIKILAESEYYILTGYKDEEGMITLSVIYGKNDEDMLPEVYVDQDWKGRVKAVKIGWASYGSQFPDVARQFSEALVSAVEFANQIDGKDYSAEFNA